MSEKISVSPSQQRWILINICFTAFIVALDTYIVNVSLPSIAHYFNLGTGNVVYVMIAYLLVTASTLPLFGKLGDKYGFKKFFIAGYPIFTIGSLLCGFAPSLGVLIAARCMQGIGGAMLYAIGTAMIPRYLPVKRRGWAFGIGATSAGLGMALGAPVGGFITEYLSWQWIFWVNVPVCIVGYIIAIKVIPPDPAAETGQKKSCGFDIPGAILSFFGLTALVFALNRGQEFGWTSTIIISLFIAAVVLLALFFIREQKCPDPLLDLALFKNTVFRNSTLACLAAFALYAGSNFLIPFYLLYTKGLSISNVGLVMMTYSVVYMFCSPVLGRFSDRLSKVNIPTAGIVSAIIACTFFAFVLRLPGITYIIIFLTWLGLSYSAFIPANNSRAMGAVPQERQGIASGVYRTMQMIGMALGVSVLETVFTLNMPGASPDTSLSRAAVSKDILYSGFHLAYIAGAVICALAFLFSLLAGKKARKES